MAKRDDFPESVKRVVAQRAGYFCSNPVCRRTTSQAHSDPSKAIITGEAAHICAAAEGGPRYDPIQTVEQRRSTSNAIWLCGDCNKKVDSDWKPWPVARLLEMKQQHERWIAAEGMTPTHPIVSLATRSGLRTHDVMPMVTPQALHNVREQELVITNPNRAPISNVKLKIALPEKLFRYGHITVPPGTQYETGNGLQGWVVDSAGDGAVVANSQKPTCNQELKIASLAASDSATFAFYTAHPIGIQLFDTLQSQPRVAADPDAEVAKFGNLLVCFIKGSYQFELRGEYVPSEFFVPAPYSFKNRQIQSLPVEDSSEKWQTLTQIEFPSVELRG